MIEIAAGDRLKFLQEEIKFRGYAIEFRINAENPEKNFMPTVGTVAEYIAPGGPGVRLDTSLYAGYTVPANYDSMVGKLIVSALDWEGTVNKARALDEFFIEGFPTNIPLHQHIVRDEDFINGKFTTNYLDEKLPQFNVVNPETQKKIEGKLQSILSRFLF